jgi:clan AA aspartic protease
MPLTGTVNTRREPIISVTVRGPSSDATLEVLVDTGFDGSLLLPRDIAARLDLSTVTTTTGALADGTRVRLDIARAQVDWLAGPRAVFVYVADAPEVLLGASLLAPHRLLIDYASSVVEIR